MSSSAVRFVLRCWAIVSTSLAMLLRAVSGRLIRVVLTCLDFLIHVELRISAF